MRQDTFPPFQNRSSTVSQLIENLNPAGKSCRTRPTGECNHWSCQKGRAGPEPDRTGPSHTALIS